jgi:hypothetical protein
MNVHVSSVPWVYESTKEMKEEVHGFTRLRINATMAAMVR